MKAKKCLSRLLNLAATLVIVCTLFVIGASAASAQEKQNMAQALSSIGLFRGYDETGTNFGLNDVPTREQALIFQIRAMGEDQAALAWRGTSPYKDVPNNHWALPYIGYGTEKGYTNGMAPGIFGVGKPADAKMMTTFVLRGMGYSEGNGDFTYNNSVAYGYQRGLNESSSIPTSFNRGDAVVILFNALSSTQKNGTTLAESLIKKGAFSTDDLLVAQAIAKGEAVANIVKADFDFVNLTGKQINKLYMTTTNTEDWGTNILGTGVLKNNYTLSLEIAFAKTTKYDVLAVYSDGSEGEFRNLSFSNATRDGGTIVLKSGSISLYPLINLPITFVNNTGLSITSLKASSSLVDAWSGNLLSSTLSNNGSRAVVFPMTAYDTEWDIQVVAGGKTYEFRNLDLSNANTSGIQLYLTMSGSNLIISANTGTQPTKVALRWSQVRVVVGKSFNMPAILTPSNSKTTVTYTSSNTSIATVDTNGKVTGVRTGTAVITAKTSNGLSAACSVGVTSDPTPTKVELDVSTLEMKVGQTYDLNGLVHPLGGTINQSWSSSNSSVVKVAGGGVITALKPGVATITVKTYNGKIDTCKVTVSGGVSSTSVTLDKSSLSIAAGQTYQLNGTIYPANTTDTVTWKSSNTTVATVSSNGLIKGVKAGSATITVTTTSGKTATCKVTVTGDYTDKTVNLYNWTDQAATDIRISSIKNSDWGGNLTSGSVQPNASVKIIVPVSGTDYTYDIKITYADGSVATFAGYSFKDFSSGSALFAYMDKGTPMLSTSKPSGGAVTGVQLDQTSISLKVGQSAQLTGTISPANATDKTVTWSSSDASVATVDANGVVKGIKAGTATITVKTTDGGKTATCKVTVIAGEDTSAASQALLTRYNGIVERFNATQAILESLGLYTSDLKTNWDSYAKQLNTAMSFLGEGSGVYTKEQITNGNAVLDSIVSLLNEIDRLIEQAKAEASKPTSITVPVTIKNNTGVAITAIYFSPANNGSWGPSVGSLQPGGSGVLPTSVTSDKLVWDLMVSDGQTNVTFTGLNLGENSASGITITLTMDANGAVLATW